MECRSTDSGITSSPSTGMEGWTITVSPEGLNIVVFWGESEKIYSLQEIWTLLQLLLLYMYIPLSLVWEFFCLVAIRVPPF